MAGGRSAVQPSPSLVSSLPFISVTLMASSISLFLSSPFVTSSQLSSSQRRFLIRCSSSQVPVSPFIKFNKRDFLWGITLGSLILKEPFRSVAREVEVGSYLPPSPSDPAFVVFKATPKDTPALRAGNVEPYKFVLPPTWKQTRIANILSGNYCQPKCAEPWIEVKFENEKQGKIQVVASPLIRLTNKPNATIEDIGTPEELIASLGPFVTGNTFDSDELLEASIEKRDGQTYYNYVLETPFALTGTHNLAKATAKGSTVVLFVASASEKQWSSAQKTLKTIIDSFEL